MAYARSDGARLWYEETGSGYPIVFVHEFGGDLRSWEQQVRCLSRDYRCIRFNARGYPPSDVPEQASSYGQAHAADDIAAVMDALSIGRAHVIGLSMGAFATLHFGLRHPERASALVVAGCGSGAPREQRDAFALQCDQAAQRFLDEGSAPVAQGMGVSATRIQLRNKDPLGWAEAIAQLAEHSPLGSALTLRNYQALRPSLYDLESQLAACDIPALLIVGDEDEPCLEANLFLKRTMRTANLLMLPGTGHAVNLEEPVAFNDAVVRFLASVERGSWRARDPRAAPGGPVLPIGPQD